MRTSTGAASSTVIVIEYSAFPPSPSSMISEISWSPAGSLASNFHSLPIGSEIMLLCHKTLTKSLLESEK